MLLLAQGPSSFVRALNIGVDVERFNCELRTLRL